MRKNLSLWHFHGHTHSIIAFGTTNIDDSIISLAHSLLEERVEILLVAAHQLWNQAAIRLLKGKIQALQGA